MQKPYKKPVSILTIIHDNESNILLLNRCDFPNFWQSVTGSQEKDETIEQTAAREVLEETGIDTARWCPHNWQKNHQYEIYEQWRHRYPPGTTHNTEHVFSLCVPREIKITLQPREHSEFIWLPIEEAAEKVFSPSNKEAILILPERGIFNG